jgi:hypothetical protein
MKLETDLKNVSFEPIKLSITIENTDELCELFTLFNINSNAVKESLEKYTKGKSVGQFNKVFDLLNAELKRLNLKKN